MRTYLLVACSLLGLVALPATPSGVRAQRDPIAVIVSPSMPTSNISLAELRSCFRGQRVTVGGVGLIPFNLPVGHDLRVAFDRAVLGLEPNQVGRFWVDMRIRDQGRAPRIAPSESLALRVASALKGAITYTRVGALPSSVKVLTVDGLAPGTRGYPLNL